MNLRATARLASGGLAFLTAAVVLFSMGHALYSAWDEGWTWDERVHLEWSRRLLDEGIDERASLGRFESKTPISLLNVLSAKGARAAGLTAEPAVRFAARLPTVACLGGLLLATFYLARRVFGDKAAHLATIAAALDPSLVGNGTLVTVDVVYALGVVLTTAAAVACIERPSARTAAALGLALGLAFTAKFSALLLLPPLAVAPFLLSAEQRRRRARLLGVAALAAGIAVSVVCAAYLFKNVGARLDSIATVSRPFGTLTRVLPGLHLPLPAAFLTGVDRSLARERGQWHNYVLGTFHPDGVWYYFPVHWAIKTPILVLLASIAGLAALVARWRLASASVLVVALVFLVHLGYFSLIFHTQVGYRFILMCIPLVYVLAAGGLIPLLERRPAWLGVVALVALAENLMYWGNPLAFTNAAVWPKHAVWRLTADSSIDYGQDRERIDGWLAKAGITETHLNPLHVLPGHNTIDMVEFVGIDNQERYRWLREHVPAQGQIGFTHLYWVIDDETYDSYLGEARRLEPTAAAAALCGDDLPSDVPTLPSGSRAPLSLSEPPGQARAFVACIAVRKTAQLGLRADRGAIRFGPMTETPCGVQVSAGQVSWYRLEPGMHALCVEEVANRRAYLAYELEGSWIVRGHSVRLSLKDRPPAP
jgi:4-amino-4-deoxy-L-arabinose transferase-like glycosyltransferase